MENINKDIKVDGIPDKGAVLGNLLYTIATQEKTKISVNRIWSLNYINSLQNSLLIMTLIIELLKSDTSVIVLDNSPIMKFIKESNLPMPEISLDGQSSLAGLYNYESSIQSTIQYNNEYKKISDVMIDIIITCQKLLSSKKRGYKTKLLYLLFALHNLPRVYLSPSSTLKISPQSALEFSSYYMKLYENCQ